MGFRKAYRQAQFNQAFNQLPSGEARTFIPAPSGGLNRAIPVHTLPQQFAAESSFVPTEIGLVAIKTAHNRAVLQDTSDRITTLIPFVGSATASSKLFAHVAGQSFTNVASFIDSDDATASVSTSISVSASPLRYDYIEINNRLIMVGGGCASSPPLTYTNASAFESWSATASGDSILNMWGINHFKSRIYCWPYDETEFFYGSTDAVFGTLEPFSLRNVTEGARRITTFFGMTRDGGSGPDDFATFIMDNGQVVVYQGSDPGDANNWSLVGVYQIGNPLGRNCAVNFGQQTAVMCDDDIYFLPQDLDRKKQPSPYARDRSRLTAGYFDELDGIFWKEKGWLMWEDGTIINTRLQGLPGAFIGQDNITTNVAKIDRMTQYRGRVFFGSQDQNDDGVVVEFQAASSPSVDGNIITAPIRGRGRGNLSLVNPIFQTTDRAGHIVYRTGVTFDYSASASAASPIFTTASASGDSTGLWQPGFGTGAAAQIHCQIVTASISTSADLVLVGFDVTYSDSGGL